MYTNIELEVWRKSIEVILKDFSSLE